MSSTTLSVIIPTYNRAEYVRNCLVSLQQSGLEDLEIIVADDGSTDNTSEVVNQTHPSARYLWQENTGTPSTARNAGFAISSGKYVAFLDCDDAWLPEIPKRAIQLLEKYREVDLLFADAKMGNPQDGYVSWIEEAGQETFFELPCREPESGFRILERRPLFRRMAVRNPLFLGACIIRREAFENSGGFDPKLRGAADWDLWLRMASTLTLGFLNEPLAYYTRHIDNMSSNKDHMSLEFCEALANTLKNCELERDDAKHIRTRLHHHLFGYAYLAYDRGDVAEARRRFARAIRTGDRSVRTLSFASVCMLPQWMVCKLRRLKQQEKS